MTGHPICETCGVQQDIAHEVCPICADERQYVGWSGQRWTTMSALAAGRRTRVEEEAPGLVGVGTEPSFAIGQRAVLVQAAAGNVLWDCTSLVDDDAVAAVQARGGLSAIALSHPHFYGAVVEWSDAFGGVPIYIHGADERWVGRRSDAVRLWSGDLLEVAPGLTLVNAGVHFEGGTVLHWADGAEGRGVLLSGDIVQVVMDRAWVSFMYSYPNLIPERPETIRRALALLEPFAFEQIVGGWWGRIVAGDAKAALRRSAARYLRQVDAHAGRQPDA